MYDSVRAAFFPLTDKDEGFVTWMYLDVKGLVTTGRGDKIDSPYEASTLPWKYPDGSIAPPAAVQEEWARVKGMWADSQRGGGWFKDQTRLRLTEEDVNALSMKSLAYMDSILAKRFSNYETIPADAQLGCLLIAWAAGPSFHFPIFQDALAREDFVTCAVEGRMNEKGNPGLHPRDDQIEHCFVSAAECVNAGLDRAVVWAY